MVSQGAAVTSRLGLAGLGPTPTRVGLFHESVPNRQVSPRGLGWAPACRRLRG
jgi:hypothetical protein